MRRNLRKRPFILLEVLIAFALIVICILPLIYPHVGMLNAQKEFVRKVELDHVVNLLYVKVLERLHLNSYGWNELLSSHFEIDSQMIAEAGYTKPFPYKGTFNFLEEKPRYKPRKAGPYHLYLFTLTFHFLPNQFSEASEAVKNRNRVSFQYKVFVVRDQRQSSGVAQ